MPASLNLIRKLMNWIGMLEPINSRFWFLYKLRTYFIMTVIINTMINGLIFTFSDGVATINKIEAMLYVIASLHLGSHQINILLHRRELIDLLNNIEDLYERALKDEHHKRLVTKCDGQTKFIIIFCIISFHTFLPATFITAFVQKIINDISKVPFQMWVPFDPETHFVLVCLYQMVGTVIPVAAMATQHGLLATISLHIATQMKIVQNILSKRDAVDIRANQVYSYRLHARTLRLVRSLNQLFSGVLVIEILISSLQCCICGYVIKKSFGEDPRLITFIFTFGITLILPLTICLSGNAITSEAEEIFLASYQNYWYNEEPKRRKELAIMMTMAKREVNLHYRFLIRFDLERYSLMLQAAYSYTTMLRMMEV